MNILLRRLGQTALGLLSATLAGAQPAFHWRSGPRPPLHPTIIQSVYKGDLLPIMGVSVDEPEVEYGGKLRRLSLRGTPFTPARGSTFAPGKIALSKMTANSSKTKLRLMFDRGGEVDGGTLSARSDFSATVMASRDYDDCYVVLIFFNQGYLDGTVDDPESVVRFKELKPLHAGENKINLSIGFMDFGDRSMGFFPLFFTHGLEIRSDRCELIAEFFRHREETIHQVLLTSYLKKHAGETKALLPYLEIPPILPDEANVESIPREVKLSFMVSGEGRVESLQLPSDVPTNVAGLLTRTIDGWLFMPRLKDGRPERTMVTIPMILRPNHQVKNSVSAKTSGT